MHDEELMAKIDKFYTDNQFIFNSKECYGIEIVSDLFRFVKNEILKNMA